MSTNCDHSRYTTLDGKSGTFQFTARIELEPKRPIYSVKWCDIGPQYDSYFAVLCGSKVFIYNNKPIENDLPVEIVQVFDEAVDGGKKNEDYLCCAWTIELPDETPLLTVGCARGQIKLISCADSRLSTVLIGHADAINEMKYHPNDPAILLTASKDESVRMWNVRTKVCVAVFAGIWGHRDEILSLDIRLQGDVFVSGGIDNSCKIWPLDTDLLNHAIKESHSDHYPNNGRPFPTRSEQYPLFSTSRLHSNYVDCVRFVGNLVLSKAPEDIVLWKPCPDDGDGEIVVLNNYVSNQNSNFWYLRFGLSTDQRYMAVGASEGNILIWDVDQHLAEPIMTLSNDRCKAVVRNVAFSRDGSTLLASCEDSTVWKWDLKAKM